MSMNLIAQRGAPQRTQSTGSLAFTPSQNSVATTMGRLRSMSLPNLPAVGNYQPQRMPQLPPLLPATVGMLNLAQGQRPGVANNIAMPWVGLPQLPRQPAVVHQHPQRPANAPNAVKRTMDSLQVKVGNGPHPPQDLVDLRTSKKTLTKEITALEQSLPIEKKNLPLIGGEKKKAAYQANVQLLATKKQSLATLEPQLAAKEKTFTARDFELRSLSTLKVHSNFLEHMTQKLNSGAGASASELNTLREMSTTQGVARKGAPKADHMAGVREASTALLGRMETLPALAGIQNVPLGILKGAGQGSDLGKTSTLTAARQLAAQNPDLQWAATVRPPEDVKKQIAANLPQGTSDLTADQKTRLVDTIYTGLMGGNSASKDQKSITLNGQQYNEVGKLGSGGAGSVRLFQNSNGGQIALKTFSGDDAGAMRELEAHRHAMGGQAGGNNVTKLQGVMRMPDGKLAAAMEVVNGGDMAKLTEKMSNANLGADQRLAVAQYMLRGAAQGMKDIHSRGMVHMDVKPENFLIDKKTLQPKISDFGTSHTRPAPTVTVQDMTSEYASPSAARLGPANAGTLTQKDDVWALGVTLFQMVEGKHPFQKNPLAEVAQFGANPNNRIYPNDANRPERQLINAMMHPDPAQRPTMDQVLQHPFLKPNGFADRKAQDILAKNNLV